MLKKYEVLQYVDNVEWRTTAKIETTMRKNSDDLYSPHYNTLKKYLLALVREGKIERKMQGNTTIYKKVNAQ